MKEVILVKYGEIALKGQNRPQFEAILMRNIKYRLKLIGKFKYMTAQSTLYIEYEGEGGGSRFERSPIERAAEALKKVFGIAAISIAAVCEKDLDDIKSCAKDYFGELLSSSSTFKVDAKRSDKSFPFKSPEIMREVGGFLHDEFPNLSVDVKNPDLLITVEIRDFAAYVHAKAAPGAGGLPVGTGGKALLLLSGGIDSPVAGHMMSKRGVSLSCIHFHAFPYTGEQSKEKVLRLASIMAEYCGDLEVYVIPFAGVQDAIAESCPEELFTVVMRRFMMRISERLAEKLGQSALVTGESLGQVASQTMQALAVTDESVGIPVLRPLIGMDKDEIVTISRRIGTFETSIEPYDDCCSLFAPKHPDTRPSLSRVMAAEEKMDTERLISEAVAGAEFLRITADHGII